MMTMMLTTDDNDDDNYYDDNYIQVCLSHILKIYHHDHSKLIDATSLLSLSLWRNTSLVATEHGWLPPEGAHRPQGTYPIVWRGEIHVHS